MTTLRGKILKGTAVLTASSVVIRLISLITVILVTRHISLHDYGVYILFLSLLGPFNIFSGLGLDELITSDVARSFGEKQYSYGRRLLSDFLRTRVLILLLMAMSGWLFRDYLSTRYAIDFTQYFFFLVAYVGLQYLRNAAGMVFQITEKFSPLAWINIVEVLGKLVMVIVLVLTIGLNLQFLILSNIITTAIVVLLFVPMAIKFYRAIPQTMPYAGAVISSVIKAHGKWQMAINIVSSLMSTITYWLLKVFLSTEAVAIFSLAQSMFSALAALVPIKTIMMPIIARYGGDEQMISHLTERVTKYSLMIFALIILSGFVLVVPMVHWFFPKYLAAISVFKILIFKLFFNAFAFTQVPFLYAHKNQRFLFGSAIFDALLVLAISPFLMQFWGVSGLVIESLMTLAIITAFREWYIRRRYGVKSITLKALFSFDKYDRVLLTEITQKFKNFAKGESASG